MAHKNYTFDEIRTKVYGVGGKASKINWLINEAGFERYDAENTYRLLMAVRDTRPEVRAAAIHFTMGIELECVNVNKPAIIRACEANGVSTNDYGRYHHTNGNSFYEFKSDSSIHSNGSDRYPTCEIVTPILRDLNSLKTVCRILNEAGANVNSSCGFHVHFGARDFTAAQWRRIILNYARLEDVIDTFMAPSRRGNASQWCRTMKTKAYRLEENTAITFDEMRGAYGWDRYHKVNLEAYPMHGTIEFRQHAGTINFAKIENWVNFLAALLTYSIQNETLVSARTIDEIPFLTAAQKTYFKTRASELSRRA